ncbi:peptidoglycan DD-metalloendopeptidase family protein, partial [Actinoplanes sp. NPDC023801]|uniref:peptidoglycan DD-metalloendopeptidase family protein n=1 Tax=Actinoplanes sp. NPDC023801 TaxID=3154595 RepID=UPI0033DE55C7
MPLSHYHPFKAMPDATYTACAGAFVRAWLVGILATLTLMLPLFAAPAAAGPGPSDPGSPAEAPLRAAEAVSVAAGPRPLFQLPFACQARVRLSTYAGHGDYDIDMSAAEGTPLLASASGTAYRGHSTRGGYQVSILHDNGWRTLYLHLRAGSYRFADGARVEQGQHVADTGNTGTDTSGPHLHYEQQNQINGSWRAVHAWFNGRPSDITDDARANSYVDTSQNCGQPPVPAGERTPFADITGDGRADMIQFHGPGNEVIVYNNRGWDQADVFAGYDRRTLTSNFDPARTKFADITGDGRADMIQFHGPGNEVIVYNNRGWD